MAWARLNQDLPSYVVMHDTRPRGDDQIWSAGFLPKTYQALALDARRKEAIDNLARDGKHNDAQQRAQLELLRQLNEEHAAARPTQADLAARINSYELAYRMQMAAPEALGPVEGDARRPTGSTASISPSVPRSPGSVCSLGGWSSAACGSCRFSPARESAATAASTTSRGTVTPTSRRTIAPAGCTPTGRPRRC